MTFMQKKKLILSWTNLGIPGMLSVSTDWAFEVCAIITGVLGQTSLAAQAVVISCNTLLLMIPRFVEIAYQFSVDTS